MAKNGGKMTSNIPTNQDVIRANIIRKHENKISILENKIQNDTENLKIQKDYLEAFKKTLIPIISKSVPVDSFTIGGSKK